MRRPWQVWAVLAVALAGLAAAMAWVTSVAIRLDDAQEKALREAAFEESIRLALWRMESAVTPLIAREMARPPSAWTAFQELRPRQKGDAEAIKVPSPLLLETPEFTRLHFEVGPLGTISSPQVPTGEDRSEAEGEVSAERLDFNCSRLEELPAILGSQPILAQTAVEAQAPGPGPGGPAAAQQPQQPPEQRLQQQREIGFNDQTYRNRQEWEARTGNFAQAAAQVSNKAPVQGAAGGEAPPGGEAILRPFWADDQLFLARPVALPGGPGIQGCWLDWPAIRRSLLEAIRDLLPAARLAPLPPGGAEPGARMLAALPVVLDPGPLPGGPSPPASPVRLSLFVAWAAIALAAIAVGTLLWGALSLSERRAAFVSAVTHELRTPLTTFRMYTEMLAEKMVPDEASRERYLRTLWTESGRLTHLVENVLAYARLERGRAPGPLAPTEIGSLLDAVGGRLRDRAEAAGMTLEIDASPEDGALVVRADPGACEQVLFNLVDNACKYAARAADRHIVIRARARPGGASIRVADRGPGILPADRSRLFHPFSKSAREAAGSAPGVGLGLALSRRLARQMGGDLRLDGAVTGGAEFVLDLRS